MSQTLGVDSDVDRDGRTERAKICFSDLDRFELGGKVKAKHMTPERYNALQARNKPQPAPLQPPGGAMAKGHTKASKTPRIAQNQAGRAFGRGMNKTEARYAQDLELQKRAGTILWYKFEGFTLTLAPGARFTPDFAVLHCSETLEFHEIKGFWREAARVRIKVAASLYPFKFIAIQAVKQKDGGGWKVEKF